jgi:hypothetical protein
VTLPGLSFGLPSFLPSIFFLAKDLRSALRNQTPFDLIGQPEGKRQNFRLMSSPSSYLSLVLKMLILFSIESWRTLITSLTLPAYPGTSLLQTAYLQLCSVINSTLLKHTMKSNSQVWRLISISVFSSLMDRVTSWLARPNVECLNFITKIHQVSLPMLLSWTTEVFVARLD